MLESLSFRHVPALIVGFTLAFGGLIPFFSTRRAMLDLGFSPRVANSPTAIPPMMIFGSRTTIIGLLVIIFCRLYPLFRDIFYSQGKFDAIDSILLTLPYAGFVDGYLVWREGNRGKAIFRIVAGNSKGLLIYGNSQPLLVPPISFFYTILMQSLRGIERFKSVTFFCGSHSYRSATVTAELRTLIMSLLSQLLQRQRFDLRFIYHEVAYHMDAGDSKAFCHIFGQLVKQFKSTNTCSATDMSSSTEDARQAIRDVDYLVLPEQATNTIGFMKWNLYTVIVYGQ
ncbi:hypothetical protein NUW58_g7763 [Xylaria curta]|uniref:Uncharacterized protein n=1 Tax=Xylaria curta TaxID=42375 RepID=A0ACC1NEX1_9PEZI|nr:hypothetical protein NUW58_g7763 [Xylaria curta]